MTDHPANDDTPDWSSTNRIAFQSKRDGNDYEIYTLDPANLESDVQQVTSNTRDDFFPNWSPDGQRIAFRSNSSDDADADSDIYTIDAQGSEQPQRLVHNSAMDSRPSWSPNGKLAFDSESGGNTDTFVVRADGGEPKALTAGPNDEEAPAWGIAP